MAKGDITTKKEIEQIKTKREEKNAIKKELAFFRALIHILWIVVIVMFIHSLMIY